MCKVERIRVAYTGAAVDDGSMDVNELAGALMALSNLIGEANRILNNDESTVDVRLTADIEHGSFELALALIRKLPEKIKLFFVGENFSLSEILNSLGLGSTLSGINLLEIFRWIKNRKVEKAEPADESTVRITIEDETREVNIGAWKLYQSQKVRRHIEGVMHPLKRDGIDGFEVRDYETRKAVERVDESEIEYYGGDVEEVEEIKSSQQMILQIVSVSFDQNLKWRFSDGESKFYATVSDEEFLKAVEVGKISFTNGDAILAEVEMRQQYTDAMLKRTEKTVTKVLKVLKS